MRKSVYTFRILIHAKCSHVSKEQREKTLTKDNQQAKPFYLMGNILVKKQEFCL